MARILTEAFDGLIGGRIVSVPAGTELSDANDGAAILAAGAATFEFTEASRVAVEAQVAAWRAVSSTKRDVKLISFVSQTAPSANTYSLSDTYTPNITSDGSATVAPVLAFGFSRVGSGAGAPSAGDTVTVWGLVEASGLVDGEVITIPLPFEAASPAIPYAALPIGDPDSDLITRASVDSPGALSVTVSVTTDTSDELYVHVIYQTAYAVDPA